MGETSLFISADCILVGVVLSKTPLMSINTPRVDSVLAKDFVFVQSVHYFKRADQNRVDFAECATINCQENDEFFRNMFWCDA